MIYKDLLDKVNEVTLPGKHITGINSSSQTANAIFSIGYTSSSLNKLK